MRFPTTMKWVGLALLGLLIASAVALAASSLVSQQIGIGSESISAGDALAPAKGDSEKGDSEKSAAPSSGGEETTPPTVNEAPTDAPTTPTSQPPSTTPVEPPESGDDYSGAGTRSGEGADD